MIIPVRCFTCGNILASKYKAYKARVKELKESSGNKDDIDSEPTLINVINNKTDEIINTPEKKSIR